MDITYTAYLLFVIPGFCFVWTYRHFTKASKLGEFEYAAWSFLFGVCMLVFSLWTGEDKMNQVLDPNKPFELFAKATGLGLGVAIAASFPFGFMAAVFSEAGFFKWVDAHLFKLLKKSGRFFKGH